MDLCLDQRNSRVDQDPATAFEGKITCGRTSSLNVKWPPLDWF
jgi:hypothetical protein